MKYDYVAWSLLVTQCYYKPRMRNACEISRHPSEHLSNEETKFVVCTSVGGLSAVHAAYFDKTALFQIKISQPSHICMCSLYISDLESRTGAFERLVTIEIPRHG
jgi:hypothetical protein